MELVVQVATWRHISATQQSPMAGSLVVRMQRLAVETARHVSPSSIATLQCSAFATVAGGRSTSRRARRQRRAKGTDKTATSSTDEASSPLTVSSRLSEMRDALKLVSNIDDLSRNGLTNRVEMPQEMLTRLVHIVKRRTHSQLKQLRENLATSEAANDRQIPLDMHKRPLGWTLDKDEQIKPFLYGPSETMAYLAEDVEMTYACAHQAFRQLQQSRPDFAPQSVLDFGAGPGTACWVAKDYYDASVTRYRVLEPSQSMVDAAEVLLDGFPGLSMRRSISEMKREIQNGLSYDLVVVNFVLSEITTDYERVAVLSALWELLSDKGVLVIVDRGSTWGSHQVRSARQFILDSVAQEEGKEEVADERAHVLAPCPHAFECPTTSKTWCHFVQRSPRVQYPRDATTKRWHGHKVSKFSYVVMEKRKASASDAAAPVPAQVGRLIRGPLLANKHVIMDLCMPNGEIERRPVTRGKSIREVYRAARKAHWGAQWPADASIYREKK